MNTIEGLPWDEIKKRAMSCLSPVEGISGAFEGKTAIGKASDLYPSGTDYPPLAARLLEDRNFESALAEKCVSLNMLPEFLDGFFNAVVIVSNEELREKRIVAVEGGYFLIGQFEDGSWCRLDYADLLSDIKRTAPRAVLGGIPPEAPPDLLPG